MNTLTQDIKDIIKSIDEAVGIPGYAVKNPRLIGQIYEGSKRVPIYPPVLAPWTQVDKTIVSPPYQTTCSRSDAGADFIGSLMHESESATT